MSSSEPTISVVIPAYNRRDSVLELLDDVYRQVNVSLEVIVVDDKSPDGTADAVEALFPQTRVLRNQVNGGPAVARNRGVREARGKFIVGFDSDVTVPDKTLLQRVVATFESHLDATGLAFRLLTPDGLTDDAPRWWHPLPLGQYANRQFQTYYFSGTGYAFRRDEVMTAGLFPEILYMHYEEVELAYRILDKGGSILYCPDLKVLHHVHPIAARNKIKIFYKPRNQILIALACHPWPHALAYLLPRLIYNFVQAMRHRHLKEYMHALSSAWQLAPQRLANRVPVRAETWRRIAIIRRSTPDSLAITSIS